MHGRAERSKNLLRVTQLLPITESQPIGPRSNAIPYAGSLSPGRINSETALKNGTRSMLDSFRDHFDSSAGAFGLAESAALAIIVIKLEAVARTQFDDCIVRADAVAVVALKTIAA